MTEYTVLIVDDETASAELTAEYIQKHSDRITTIIESNPTNTTDYGLTTGEIDCILSDYDMPQQTGLELLDTVREHNTDIPFILYTGKGSEEIASKAVSKGVTDYMQKSTGSDHYLMLTNRLENAVETYHSKLLERNSIEGEIINSVQEIISTPTDDISKKVTKILELGANYVGVSSGFLSHITDDTLHIVEWYNENGDPTPVDSCPIEESYCQHTVNTTEPLVIEEASGTMYEQYNTTEDMNIESYIGSPVYINDSYYGTICFIGHEKAEFSESDEQFIGMIGKWIGYELTQHSIKQQLETDAEQSEQFSKMLSHDLRNVFSVTEGYADLLVESDTLDEKDKEYAQKIADSMDRVISITENLKILHESEGKIDSDSTTEVNIAELLTEAWNEFCGEHCGSHLEIDPDLNTDTITANKSLLKQAFGNILLNAIEHNEGIVTVTVTGTYSETGNLKQIQITDDGTGFENDPEQYLSPTTNDVDGSGIGLYIVKKVCQHHLWNITATNHPHPEKGAQFTICFNPEDYNLDKSVLANEAPTPVRPSD